MTFLRIVIPLYPLFEHDLFGKPVPTFPDHALDHDPIGLNRIMISSFCWSMISGQTLRVCPEGKPVPTFPDHALKKLLGRHAEQDPPDLFEMGGACLDLLRKRVHVAEAALERAAREDRVDARSLVGEVYHLGRPLDRVGAGEPHAGP